MKRVGRKKENSNMAVNEGNGKTFTCLYKAKKKGDKKR